LGSPTTTYDPLKELGLNGHTYASRFPRIEMGTSTAALGGMNSLGPGSFNEKYFERRTAGNVSASYVTRAHTIKLGAENRLEKYPSYRWASRGRVHLALAGRQTDTGRLHHAGFDGFQLSSFLLGGMSAFYRTLVRPEPARLRRRCIQDMEDDTQVDDGPGLRWDWDLRE
jgi:hypothetical protein